MVYAGAMRKNLSLLFVAFGLLWISGCMLEEPAPEFDDESALMSEAEADGDVTAKALQGPCDISRTCSTGNVVSCHGEGYCRVGGSGTGAYVECDGERTLCLIITPDQEKTPEK